MDFNRLPIGVSLSSLGVRAATAKLASPLSEPPRFEWGARSRARAVNLPRALSPRPGYANLNRLAAAIASPVMSVMNASPSDNRIKLSPMQFPQTHKLKVSVPSASG
jgi:hypothetical protein